MNELAEALADTSQTLALEFDELARLNTSSEEHALQTAAEKWAISSLRSYKGELLSAALSISVDLINFLDLMQVGRNKDERDRILEGSSQ